MNPLIPAIISSVLNAVTSGELGDGAPPPPAQQVLRTIPADAKFARMQPPQMDSVTLDSTEFHLSPGAQIRSADNRIVMPATVQAPVTVRYQLDGTGNVYRVWILTAVEAQQR
jgi:hypothetical protein